jgi:hypothetical protein
MIDKLFVSALKSGQHRHNAASRRGVNTMRVPIVSCVVFAMALSACAPSAPPAAHKPLLVAAPTAMPAKPIPPPSAPPAATGAFAGEALSHLLMCGDPDFLAQASAKQSKALQTEPRLHCQPPTSNGTLSCTPAEPVSAFGLRIVGFTLTHANGGHGLSAQLQGDLPTLLQGFAQVYPNPVRSALEGKLVSLSPDDSLAFRARESDESGQVNYECRVAAAGELLFVTLNEPMTASAPMLSSISTPAPAATATSTLATAHAPAPTLKVTTSTLASGTSAIAGHIEFPGESIPALHICAISDDNGAAACVRTEREQSRYRIENLPGGNYQIWAWLPAPEGDMRVMRAAHEVQCTTAPCPPQTRTVALPADTKVDGMTINDAAASYPDQPPEPAN